MIGILFVDDEPMVLEGLANALRKHRKEWRMTFAVGGEEALARLEEEHFDVVVADMRMPGMSGEQLLERVRARWPETARIVLSGQTDEDVARRLVHLAHQFLAKPSDAETIHRVVSRAHRLQSLLQDDALRQLVGRMGQLPSLPELFVQVRDLLDDPEHTMGDLGDLIGQDPALAAKVVQIVNSAFFGMATKVTNVGKAVNYLGGRTVRDVVLGVEVFHNVPDVAKATGVDPGELQQAALRAAGLTSAIAGSVHPDLRDDGYLAGLLVNVGLLVLASRLPEVLAPMIAQARDTGRPLHEIEREFQRQTHAEIGAYLLGLWGLPMAVVEAVADQHTPGRLDDTAFGLAGCLHVAVALLSDESLLDREYLRTVGVEDRLDGWRELARTTFAAVPA
ncbi:MAG: HDOD domain-containing protein [Thermoleophilia bacterium]|nr:HDOD domain-containing protein [Thermoleophilia bacterium]